MVKNTKHCKQSSEVCDIANVFEKFGKYQVIQFIYLCLPGIFINMISINYIFTAGDLNYRCRIPECEDLNTSYDTAWWPNASIDRCSKPMLSEDYTLGSGCTNESFSGLLEECQEWVYETNNTVIAELDLACRPWLSNMIGTIHNSGMLVSMIVSGWLSDRFGRKPTLIFCTVCSCIGQLKTLATSYVMYVIIEFCEAAVTGGTYTTAIILMLEMCGPSNRAMSGVVFAYAIYLGECLYAVIGMFVPYWKNLIHIINGPTILFISYIFLVKESPRWQILNGKTEKAKDTMLLAANMNKVNIDRQELAELDEVSLKTKFNIGAHEKTEGFKAILTSKEIMKRTLVAAVCRFTASFVYYGMMVNSVYLPGDKYINFLLATVMSFPGELIALYVINRIGRQMPLLVGYLICGVVSVATGYVPSSSTWAKITMFLIGKMLISVCFTGALTYIMELFPTSVRGSLLGATSFASRGGAMLAPLTPILNPISEALPSILFGCSSLLSAALLTLTPETKGLPLMDTIRQVEESVTKAKETKKTGGTDNSGFEDVMTKV